MENTTPEHVKCLIIGSGPAGYTAAIYAARANMQPVMYQGLQPGGQLTITNDVENFPGYPDGIMGPEMMEDLKKQAARFGTDIRYGLATSVDFSGQPHRVTIDEKIELTADAVILATGASAKWLGIPSEQRLNGSGVSACAVCDGFFYRGKDVAIVGAGDTAAEEATYLANLCNKVYMLVRKGEMRASRIMQKRVEDNPKIEILWNTVTDEILGEHAVEGVRVKNVLTHETREIAIHGFFVAIGHEPNSKIFQPYLHHDEQGYLKTIPGTSKTNVDGVFACGDVQDYTYRQAVTAAGTGCMAALDAERYLAAKDLH
ncbi:MULTISPECIES: thioredoxin-disulfide reductase [Hymenobacter]|uniref:Thioredoxin reductase n=1 Tax=Hymenobacter guriensis TaxID=2793065 RepID=A0ABS0L3J1_9BACT|nr:MULTISPECIES: thioredoxin-disulfide reductase [Hymenobacter]MBG8554686.1 thioredoxin-disulfide reductase [Hymenobacter guriensis]MCR5890182.1 thioredoxin-disulfide reductase [Hymenobacter sp. J193]